MQELLVIKIGGNIIDDELLLNNFLKNLSKINKSIILIHGGGKLATNLAKDLNIPQQIIDGRRITDADTLKVVTMVYAGYINKTIVTKLQANKINAFGLCGADGNLIYATKRNHPTVDYGYVGDIQIVNIDVIVMLLKHNYLPVIAPISHNHEAQLLNTNADTIANEIATSLSKHYKVSLLYCFDKVGVLQNIEDENSVISIINAENIDELKKQKIIHSGMLPKIDNAFQAINKGVFKVVLGHANDIQQLVDGTKGTTIFT